MNDIDLTSHEIAASAERSVPSSEIELWETLRAEAGRIAAREEQLRAFLDAAVQRQVSFGAALARLLARKLADMSMSADRLDGLGPRWAGGVRMDGFNSGDELQREAVDFRWRPLHGHCHPPDRPHLVYR